MYLIVSGIKVCMISRQAKRIVSLDSEFGSDFPMIILWSSSRNEKWLFFSEIKTLTSWGVLQHQPSFNFSILCGIEMLSIEDEKNASFPNDWSSESSENWIIRRFLQNESAFSPICVTFDGIEILLSEVM